MGDSKRLGRIADKDLQRPPRNHVQFEPHDDQESEDRSRRRAAIISILTLPNVNIFVFFRRGVAKTAASASRRRTCFNVIATKGTTSRATNCDKHKTSGSRLEPSRKDEASRL